MRFFWRFLLKRKVFSTHDYWLLSLPILAVSSYLKPTISFKKASTDRSSWFSRNHRSFDQTKAKKLKLCLSTCLWNGLLKAFVLSFRQRLKSKNKSRNRNVMSLSRSPEIAHFLARLPVDRITMALKCDRNEQIIKYEKKTIKDRRTIGTVDLAPIPH